MNKNRDFSFNIGMPSILLIFVVLCLVSFGVLSLVSASSDLKLAKKVADRQSAYYSSCNQAEETLKELDKNLHEYLEESDDTDDYLSKTAGIQTHYVLPVTEIQSLRIDIELIIPTDESGAEPHTLNTTKYSDSKLYRILSWTLSTDESLEYDESLHLMEIEDF